MKIIKLLDTFVVTNPEFGIDDENNESIITLGKLYKNGWWITEVFGTEAFIVKRVALHSFVCLTCHFRSPCSEELAKFIEKFADKKYKKWRKYLLGIK